MNALFTGEESTSESYLPLHHLSRSLSVDAVWNIPYYNLKYNLGSFGSCTLSDEIDKIQSQKQFDKNAITARGEITRHTIDSGSFRDVLEKDDESYSDSWNSEEQKPSMMRRFEESFVKGMPREYRHGTTKDAFPVKENKRHVSSFLVYAIGQFLMFGLLVVQYEHQAILTDNVWMLVLGVINILFSGMIVGYAFVNIFGYMVARKLAVIKAKSMIRVWKMKPTHDQARFALWMNACWVLCGLLSMGVNFILLLVERCLGNPPLPLDLLIIFILITVIYIVFAIIHRKLAYCCWYNWYRRYDQSNSLGTWGSSNNGNVKKSVLFARFNNEPSIAPPNLQATAD